VLIAVFPAVAVCLRTGQNGMLTGALFGLFACWFLRGNRLAAVPLGLLTYKPHLLLGMGLLLILGRAWQVILLSAAITLALLAVATALFGMGIWPAFLSSVAEAGDFLSAGIYPMFRMTSVYATVQSLGFPVWAASVAQAAVAIGAIGVLLLVHRRRLPRRQALGIGMLTTVFFSPYAYDYDLSVLGVALALLLPDTVARATGRALFVMVALLWVACGAGITLALLAPALHLGREHLPSLGAVALVPFCLLVLRIQFGMRESGH
jgi:hypothetical protein